MFDTCFSPLAGKIRIRQRKITSPSPNNGAIAMSCGPFLRTVRQRNSGHQNGAGRELAAEFGGAPSVLLYGHVRPSEN